MLNLDLEPRPDYTYRLENITLTGDSMAFDIPRKFDTRSCQLSKQENEVFEGSCVSDQSIQGETSKITAKPKAMPINYCQTPANAEEEDTSKQ